MTAQAAEDPAAGDPPARGPGGDPAEDVVAAHAGGRWRRYAPGSGVDPVLAAALEAFAELGFHGSSVRDIARRAHLSVPGLYHHRASKHDMLLALVQTGTRDVLARSRAALADAGPDPVARFSALVECLVLYMTHRRDLGVLHAEARALEPDAWRSYVALRDQQEQLVVDAVAAGQSAGAFTAADSPDDAARAVLTLCLGVADWFRPDGPLPPEALARQYVRFCLRLVGHAAAAGPPDPRPTRPRTRKVAP